MRLPGVTTGSTFFRPEGTGSGWTNPPRKPTDLTPIIKADLLAAFFSSLSNLLRSAVEKYHLIAPDVLTAFGHDIRKPSKLLDRQADKERDYCLVGSAVFDPSSFSLAQAISNLPAFSSPFLIRALDQYSPEDLKKALFFEWTSPEIVRNIVAYHFFKGEEKKLLEQFSSQNPGTEKKLALSTRVAAELLRLGEFEVSLQLLKRVQEAPMEDISSLAAGDTKSLEERLAEIHKIMQEYIGGLHSIEALNLLTDKYKAEGCPKQDDRLIANAGFFFSCQTVDEAGLSVINALLKAGQAARSIYLSPKSAVHMLALFWEEIKSEHPEIRKRALAALRSFFLGTNILPEVVMINMLTGNIDTSLLVKKPDKPNPPPPDQPITIRDVAPEIGITGLPIDREHYDEIRDVVILKHGDILPGHNFILGKPESYINGERELLTINTNPTSKLVPILEQARQMAEARQGNLVDLAYAIADMVHRSYSRSQGKIVGAVQQTLGGPIAFGGNCRKRSATLQMAYQVAGVPSRRDRGFFMLQENGWHAWVLVAPKSPLAFIVDLNVDPRELGTGQEHQEYNRGQVVPSKYKIDKYPDYPAFEVNGLHYTREGDGAVVWRPKY